MREVRGFVFAIAMASVLVAIAATPSDAAAKKKYVRSRAYDGLWSVSIRTQSGPCDPSYRYPARIVGGQIVPATTTFNYQISGNVVASGAIAVTVSKGGKAPPATAGCGARAAAAAGAPAAIPVTGTWSAMRRASN